MSISSFDPLSCLISSRLLSVRDMSEAILEQTASLPADEALAVLNQHRSQYEDDVPFLSHVAECALEVGDVDDAYHCLTKACQLDPEAAQGPEKFFSLGQITGGEEGVAYFTTGLARLRNTLENGVTTPEVIAKMISAIFATVEIWLTDLADHDESLAKCQELLEYAHQLDDSNGETYALKAQVLILENKFADASTAIHRAWELIQQRLAQLAAEGSQDPFVYVELIQPMASMIKSALETANYELAALMCQRVAEIDDNLLEIYYYEALAHLMSVKQALGLDLDADVDAVVQAIQAHGDATQKAELESMVTDARSALTQGFRVIQTAEDADADVVEQVNQMLKPLGGPNMKELMPQKDEDVNVDGWEEELDD
ncbi:hypothetical protein DIURU_005568 [Diutina rugosa]|uniref:Assembly chaperone of RPL4 n=1 Tax=Diutina rugosa TaxID=5481 RepID=A0A642UGX3_DIURU|nr:uncharacterized protein DIURU_005568 [Diutina rugosa]KAA8896828.1 hypothetical protein DIURU_005568 [Diutina rugosa]